MRNSTRTLKILHRKFNWKCYGVKTPLKGIYLPLVVRQEHFINMDAEGDMTGGQIYLSMFVVDAEGDGGGVCEQPRLLLIHLLPQTLHAALTLRCFLYTHRHTHTQTSKPTFTSLFVARNNIKLIN